ncbi:MAG: Bax inhibitor-1/YccA family protein [Lentisphaeria bacterium]|nr:Bax inhibitor-1/YccA family protein [Lentisphaeria bacterium]
MRNREFDYRASAREAELEAEVRAARDGDVVAARSFMNRVYNWMAVGLALTGVIAYGISEYMMANQPRLSASGEFTGGSILWSPTAMLVLILLEFGLVIWISAGINKMSAGLASGLFLLYAAINGVTLAPIFLVYTQGSIATTFFACAGTFLVTSIFGYVTRMDLSGLGGLCMLGLFGIIIASLINFFTQSEGLDMIITYIGVFVFIGLTAWDTQKLRQLGGITGPDSVTLSKYVILGALTLYLDFINLFLMLLRLFGDRK